MCMFFIFLVALAVLCISPDYMNPTLIGSVMVLLCCEILLYRDFAKVRIRKKLTGKNYISVLVFTVILSMIFMGMLSVKELWGIRQAFKYKALFLGYICVFFMALCYIFYTILTHCLVKNHDNNLIRNDYPYIKIGQVRIYRLLWFCLIAAVLVLAANFPWRPSPDAETVYRYVINEDWNDWHPIGYLMFVRVCMSLLTPGTNHPFSVLLFQSILWLLLMNHVMDRLYSWTGSIWSIRAFMAFNLIIFTPVLYLGLMYKDVLYSMCMMGVSVEIFHMLYTDKMSWKSFLLLSVFSSGVALFRHMGAEMVTLVLMVVLFCCFLKKKSYCKKLGLLMFIPVICFTLVSTIYGSHVLHMKKSPVYITYTMPISIVGDFALRQPEIFTQKEKEFLEEVMPIEEWARGYQSDPYWVDMLARSYGLTGDRIERIDAKYGHKLVRLNASLFMRNPKEYICALLRPTSIIWQIFRPADGYEWTIAGYYKPSDRPDLVESNLVTSDKLLSELMGNIEYTLMENPLLSALYSRGGIWCFSLLFISGLWIIRRQKLYLLVFALPFLNTALMMLSCPAQDPRYILPVMETAFVFISVISAPGDITVTKIEKNQKN